MLQRPFSNLGVQLEEKAIVVEVEAARIQVHGLGADDGGVVHGVDVDVEQVGNLIRMQTFQGDGGDERRKRAREKTREEFTVNGCRKRYLVLLCTLTLSVRLPFIDHAPYSPLTGRFMHAAVVKSRMILYSMEAM